MQETACQQKELCCSTIGGCARGAALWHAWTRAEHGVLFSNAMVVSAPRCNLCNPDSACLSPASHPVLYHAVHPSSPPPPPVTYLVLPCIGGQRRTDAPHTPPTDCLGPLSHLLPHLVLQHSATLCYLCAPRTPLTIHLSPSPTLFSSALVTSGAQVPSSDSSAEGVAEADCSCTCCSWFSCCSCSWLN